MADLAGLLALAALLGWVAFAGARAGNADPLLGLLLSVAGVFTLARVVTRLHAWAVPAAVAVGGAVVAVTGWDVLLDGPLSSPLGYSNATAAFFVQAAAAAVMVALRCPAPAVRAGALALAAAFAVVPWGNGTDTAAVLVLGLAAAGAVHAGRLRAATVLGVGVAAVLAVLVVTTVVGATYSPDREGATDTLVDATLSERRAVLWHDALTLMRAEPLAGVGPGRFRETSPTALDDSDAAWAHHELLQLGAETGVAGLLLGLALAGYAFAQLRVGPRDAATAAAAVALAAVAIHASVDYVLHFPAVALAAAAVAGAGRARPHGRHRAEPS